MARKGIITLFIVLSVVLAHQGQAQPRLSAEQSAALDAVQGARPNLLAYHQQHQFVTDLLAWKARRKALIKKLQRGENLLPLKPQPSADWHHVTGPEDLDIAIRNAEGYIQPHYQERKRFDRTTHLSFPLPALESRQLAEKAVTSRPLPTTIKRTGAPEILLQENVRLQREIAASRVSTSAPVAARQHSVSQVRIR